MLDWLVRKLCQPGSIVYGNCYLAVLLIYRFGGHLIITRSVGHDKILHVSYAPDLAPTKVLHLLPLKRKHGWRAIFASPFFKGKWVWGVIPHVMDREASDATIDRYKRN